MSSRTYRFGEFELNEPLFELRCAGVRVELQPKAMSLLLHLLRHRDRVVMKEELLAEIWPDAVVSEASLSKAISAVRRALGDSGGAQAFIKTVRGRGFRFAVDVAEGTTGLDAVAAPPEVPEAESVFVGREDILGLITTTAAAAAKGTGRVVLLAGEPGMGKTRTVMEAAAQAGRSGMTVLTGWCAEQEGAPALWPWRQPLSHLLDRARDSIPPEMQDALADLAPLLPALRERLPVAARSVSANSEQACYPLFDSVVELLRRVTGTAPHMLILDDFHWADGASLQLLGFLCRELATLRLVIVVTYRADDLATGHPLHALVRRPECASVTLNGLDPAQVARLLESERGGAVDPALAAAIHERTGGNPFFVKELARVPDGHLAGASSLASSPLPAGIREVLRQRLDRLLPACRQVLVVGAAMGRDLDPDVVAAVAGERVESVLERLDEARAAHVIHRANGGYAFAHALVRDALLETIPPGERAHLHRRIGEAIEARYRGDLASRYFQLAYHFCAGAPSGAAEQAIAYAQRAGERAARSLAPDEAVAHYRRALEIEPLLPARNDRLRCELVLTLGEAQVSAGHGEEGRDTLRQAADLARRLGSAEHLARAALAFGGLELSTEVGVYDPDLIGLLEEALTALPDVASPLRVRVLVRLAIGLMWARAYERCAELNARAVELARRVDDPEALAHALYTHRWGLMGPDNLAPRLAASDEMLQLARRAANRELELGARSCRFLDLIELGRISEAERELDAYERLATLLRVPRYRWRARFYRIMRVLLEGRFAEAEWLSLQALAEEDRFKPVDAGQVFGVQLGTLRREQDRAAEMEQVLRNFVDRFPAMATWRTGLALAHADMGRLADARDELETFAVDGFQTVPRDYMWIPCLVILGEVCGALGDAERAAMLYEILSPYAPRTVVVGAGVACWGALDRFLGSLAITRGDWPAAAHHLEEALRMNVRMGARPWVGWTHYELARLMLLRNGKDDRVAAQAHLARAQESAQALGMTRLGNRAAQLAATLA